MSAKSVYGGGKGGIVILLLGGFFSVTVKLDSLIRTYMSSSLPAILTPRFPSPSKPALRHCSVGMCTAAFRATASELCHSDVTVLS